MKKCVAFLMFCFALAFCSTCFGNEGRWRWIYSDEHSGHYFDVQTLTYTYTPEQKLIIKAWIKVQHTAWYAQEIVRINHYNMAKYSDYSYDLWGCEIDVPDRMIRFTTLLHYDDEGNILYGDKIIRDWLTILPESVSEQYYNHIVRYLYGYDN